jgi:hypothetical protein
LSGIESEVPLAYNMKDYSTGDRIAAIERLVKKIDEFWDTKSSSARASLIFSSSVKPFGIVSAEGYLGVFPRPVSASQAC